MEYSGKFKFIDAPSYFAANRDSDYSDFTYASREGSMFIDTGSILLVYSPNGEPFNSTNLQAFIKQGRDRINWTPGMKNTGNLGGTIRTVDGVGEPCDLGDGVLSRAGWYLMDDSRGHLLKDGWVESRPKDAGTDWYLFGYGTDLKAGLRALTEIGGRVPMPRKYTLGSWYSRYWPYTSDDYRKIVGEYDKKGFPLDVMVLDMDWHKDGWTGWSINRKLLPDFEDLMDWFHGQGLHVTLNVHPADGVGKHEDMYADFMKAMGKSENDPPLLYDVGDKKYLDTMFKYTHVPLEDKGVDFWWLDWQQYPFTRSIPDLTNLSWLNEYYTRHTGRTGLRPTSFSRWSGWGDHRHPIHFSGDAFTFWSMLAFEVPFTATAGNIGCFYWSHDIGGHMGPRNKESYTRWIQFGATTAALRLHSTRSPEQDRRPWKYPEWSEKSARISFRLRSRIFPYIYSSVWQGYSESIPLNRPMYLEYPENEKSYRNPQQYLFGDAMLAAPIVTPGVGPDRVGIQTVWFPEGLWYNMFTGERYDGDTEAVVAADIYETPLYVRGGVPIPTQEYTPRMGTAPLNNLVVRCYPGEDGSSYSFTLYEDDGDGSGYERGEYATTKLTCARDGDNYTVTVAPAEGDYKGMLREREITVQLPVTSKADAASIDGKDAAAEYDEEALTNVVRVPKRPVGSETVVRISAVAVEPKVMTLVSADRRASSILRGVAKAGEEEKAQLTETLLAVGGIALMSKNEGLYLYEENDRVYFYARPGVIDEDRFNITVLDVSGDNVVEIESGRRKIDASGAYLFPNGDGLAEPPSLGIPSRRVAKVDFKINGKEFSFSKDILKRPSYIEKWNLIGPFTKTTFPETAFGSFYPDMDKTYEGVGGQGVKAKHAKKMKDGVVDLQKMFISDNISVFAATYIYSKTEQSAKLYVNAENAATFWLNGENIGRTSNRMEQEQSKISVTLKPGANLLLVKADQDWGEFNLRVAVESEQPLKHSYSKR